MTAGTAFHGSIVCLGLTPAVQRTLRFRRFRPGEVNRAVSSTLSPAGKAVNVARALKTLGEDPIAMGLAGGDTGRWVEDGLLEHGIRTHFVPAFGDTRTCTTAVDESNGVVTELVEEAPTPTADELEALAVAVDKLLGADGMLLISGALPPGTPHDFYARAIRRAGGARCLVDTQRQPLLDALDAQPFLVKLNAEELAATLGEACEGLEVPRAARRLLAAGATWVAVTDGPRAAWLLDATTAWRFTPPTIEPVNPIGSGDALLAGLAHALRRHADVPRAFAEGMACAAANALTWTPCALNVGDMQRLLNEIRMERNDGPV